MVCGIIYLRIRWTRKRALPVHGEGAGQEVKSFCCNWDFGDKILQGTNTLNINDTFLFI